MKTLYAKWGGDTIQVTADWSQAACPITGDLDGGYQVADFRHNPRHALRHALSDCARVEGLHPAKAGPMIDAAMSGAQWDDA